nr:TolC family protein [Prevotella sp.]
MRNRYIIGMGACLMLLCMSSCQVYKAYERPELKTDSLYRSNQAMNQTVMQADSASCFGNLSWREVFTDTSLQKLIEQGLANNTDLKTARLRITEAEASLKAAKLAYYPSISFSPQGGISSFNGNATVKTYSMPVTASWEVGVFGSLLNTKRKAKAAVEQSEAYRQAVQTQLIATIANDYYTLLMLDRQLEISKETADSWKASVQTMRDMKEDGMTNEAAVAQSEANYRSILANIPDLKRSIHEMENSLCMVLGCSPQTIERSSMKDITCPTDFKTGVPLQLLSNRPDVRQAESNLKMAYYATNIARSAFYPGITIDASAGWTNSAGEAITNPAKFLISAVGSIVQPIFSRGKNVANLKIAKAQQEEALLAFQQSLLNAGSEVSDALYMYESAKDKSQHRTEQIAALESSVSSTKALFHDGTSTYLEVLTAQQDLFSAQLSQVNDRFEQLQATINLYHALGGGRE